MRGLAWCHLCSPAGLRVAVFMLEDGERSVRGPFAQVEATSLASRLATNHRSQQSCCCCCCFCFWWCFAAALPLPLVSIDGPTNANGVTLSYLRAWVCLYLSALGAVVWMLLVLLVFLMISSTTLALSALKCSWCASCPPRS